MYIVAGIVLYNPDLKRLEKEIESIYEQVSEVVLFDNFSKNIAEVRKIISQYENVKLICGNKNYGIGYALNRIMDYSLGNGYEWLLTLDHDSICEKDLINKYKKYLCMDKVGMLCPQVYDDRLGTNPWYTNSKNDFDEVKRCIQSGCLVNLKALKDIGGFDEWMFIDFVDFDICMKMQINNYKIYRINSICINHELGNREDVKLHKLYSKISEITHVKKIKSLSYLNIFSYDRAYYVTRNNIVYIKKYKRYINEGKEYFVFLKRVLQRILRSKNRVMMLKASIKGINDGFKVDIEPYSIDVS